VASRTESTVVYAAGAAQGIVLVTFPAAGAIFTAPDMYDLSNTQYGAMFLPQVFAAIAASLAGAGLSGRLGTKRVYMVGLAAGLVSMTLLLISDLVMGDSAAYPLLLAATASLGLGFGLTVPALNTFTAAFHPSSTGSAVLTLNALLGLGTALAPLFVAIFVGLGFWWGLPVLSCILLVGLIAVSARLPLVIPVAAQAAGGARTGGMPSRLYLFAGFALLYGICETVNGNWSSLDLKELGASATAASLALTAFWAMVTVGRIVFSAIRSWFPLQRTFHLLPFALTLAFLVIAKLPDNEPALGILAFAFAGLCCSALLPLVISFGQDEFREIQQAVAGGLIAAYQVGYGIAAFGVGPLRDDGVALSTIYASTAVVAAGMGLLSFAVLRRPRPAPVTPAGTPGDRRSAPG
jgi:MFS family permease